MGAAVAAVTCLGQTHKVAAGPETVVRAVGVYEWTGDLTKPTGSRFMPVTVFIDGDLEDAGIYKPQPVPFALEPGNIYEVQDAGLAKGTVVLDSALHAKLPDGAPGPAFDEGWMGYGAYKASSEPKHTAALKPSKNLPVISASGGNSSKPHLTNKTGDAAGKSQDQGSAGQAQQGSQQGSKSDTNAKAGDTAQDPDRPTMHRRTADDAKTAGTDDAKTNSSDHDAERPTLKRRSPEEEKEAQREEKEGKKKNDTASVTGGGSLNDDPDRPRLHHGGEERGDKGAPKLMGVPKDMHQMVAVSDAKSRDPHPFARPWEDSNEHTAILSKMQAFARAKLAEYGVVPGITPASAIGTVSGARSGPTTAAGSTTAATPDSGPPTLKRGIPKPSTVNTESPAPTPPSTRSASTKSTAHTAARPSAHVRAKARTAASTAAPVTLADEVLKGYTLSYGGSATYVYMAHTVETGSVMRYVTVVAQDDGMGALKVAVASVTDAAHLDRTPWMRLIDAVDVEASNRASLLFELRGQSSRQFALYRVIAAKPEQIFLTGNAS